MPGTTVTLAGPALLQPQSTIASAGGTYRFPNLQIGVYTVTFELTGFKRVIRAEVRIQAGFNAEVNGRLELSSVEETVTVTGESPIVDTRSNTLGTNFGKELLEKIHAEVRAVLVEDPPGGLQVILFVALVFGTINVVGGFVVAVLTLRAADREPSGAEG